MSPQTAVTYAILAIFLPLSYLGAGNIATDGTMGPAQNLTGPNYAIPQALGHTVGSNLFHSFSNFDLAAGDVATFTGASNIQNVISRVTSNVPSSIDGTIRSQLPNASFFFINPAGIVFGPNSAVDVPGSFHATTANELRFQDGSTYGISTAAGNLTAAAPVAFGFLTPTGNLSIEAGKLNFQAGSTVSLSAGSVTTTNAEIKIPGGSLQVYGQGNTVATVPIQGALPAGTGNITADNGLWRIQGDGGGTIWISGGTVKITNTAAISTVNNGAAATTGSFNILASELLIDNGAIGTLTTSDGNSGAININVSGNTQVINDSWILTRTKSAGNSGNINLRVNGDLTVDNFTWIESEAEGSGKAGDIKLKVDGQIAVLDGSSIFSITMGAGNAGNITIDSKNLIIDRQNSIHATDISSTNYLLSTGRPGDIVITTTDYVQMLNGGKISTSSYGNTEAGNITINAGSLAIDGHGASTGISAQGYKSNLIGTTTGSPGNINLIIQEDIQVLNGGFIFAYNQGPTASEGGITIHARDLIIDRGANTNSATYMSTTTLSSGSAGSINIDLHGTLQVLRGGGISSDTFSSGNGGMITIVAQNLIIDRQGSTNVTDISAMTNNTGAGGLISITIRDAISLIDGGAINAIATSSGTAGDVTIHAKNITIDGYGLTVSSSGIDSETYLGSTGNAGTVTVTADEELRMINNGFISTSTQGTGLGGNISITARNLILDYTMGDFLTNSTGIFSNTEYSTGNAGTISIIATEMQVLNGSTISSNTDAGSSGNAGVITITAHNLTLDGAGKLTRITAETKGQGKAGDIIVTVNNSLNLIAGGVLTSSTLNQGAGGKLIVTAKNLIIHGISGVYSGITTQATKTSSANVGIIQLNVSNEIRILEYSSVSNANYGTGDAGVIQITAGRLLQIAAGSNVISSARTGKGGDITINAPITILNNGQIITSVFGDYTTGLNGGDGGDITVNSGYLVMDTGFIQANTTGVGAKGGNIFINTDGVIANGGQVAVGGQTRQIYQANSGVNVIQAAAEAGVSGNITLRSPDVYAASGLVGTSKQLAPASKYGLISCEQLRKQQPLQITNRGGFPAKILDSINTNSSYLARTPCTN
ncbi:hypothetical protein TI04_03970 [Achromatium sp. WMS2]|nr:hypothetical protein TI04_03970 [Achromatium sp. WMS2]